MGLDFAFIREFLPEMLRGMRITVIATVAGFALALVIGALLEGLRRSGWRAARLCAQGWISFIRCTPLLVQLYFVFYVLPRYGLRLEALTTGMLCLGNHIGAYVAETYRAGIDAVPSGQWDAGRSLGLRRLALWLRVILPQALPPALPVLGNYFIGLFKETPLLAAITVIDVFGAANSIAGSTFRYNEPYLTAAFLLLAVSLIASWLVRQLERRVAQRRGHDPSSPVKQRSPIG